MSASRSRPAASPPCWRHGAGKTTTLRAIATWCAPRVWSVSTARTWPAWRPRKSCGSGSPTCPRVAGTFTTLTVDENLRIAAYTRKDKQAVRDELERVFTYFPRLKERVQQQAGTLSGGEQQMLAIARALDAEAAPDAAR